MQLTKKKYMTNFILIILMVMGSIFSLKTVHSQTINYKSQSLFIYKFTKYIYWPETKTKEDFIIREKKAHGNKYDYSKVEYVGCKTKVIIICRKHGEFEQVPEYHSCGYGCSKCGGSLPLNTKTFIKKATKIHGDKFNYSKVKYVNYKSEDKQYFGGFVNLAQSNINQVFEEFCTRLSLKHDENTHNIITKHFSDKNSDSDWKKRTDLLKEYFLVLGLYELYPYAARLPYQSRFG